MGQYYTPVFMDNQGEICTLYAHDFDNGLKLMEHSYIGNDFVNAALILLLNKPSSVAWIGDYSDNPYEGLLCGETAGKRVQAHLQHGLGGEGRMEGAGSIL